MKSRKFLLIHAEMLGGVGIKVGPIEKERGSILEPFLLVGDGCI